MRLFLFLVVLLFFASTVRSEPLKTVFNPFTGKPDYITKMDSTTLPSGSTQYIQNTFTPSTTTQVFTVSRGKFGVLGYVMTDNTNCTWDVTIATTGALTTTLRSCTGMCIGLLCGLTYTSYP